MKGHKIDVVSALAGLALGLGAGAAAGYLLARVKDRNQMEHRIASEVAAVKEHYRARAEAAGSGTGHTDYGTSAVGEAGMGLGDSHAKGARPLRRVVPIADADFYPGDEGPVPAPVAPDGDPLEGYPDDDDDDDDAGDEEESGFPPDDEPERIDTGPYVISRAEFFDETTRGSDYQKLTITWYEKDGVLVDDGNRPVPDIAGTIGRDFAARFGDNSDDPTVVYIRNNKLEVDFEVCHDERAYTEVVLGYGGG